MGWGSGNSGGTVKDTGRSLRISVRAGDPESVFEIEVVEAASKIKYYNDCVDYFVYLKVKKDFDI